MVVELHGQLMERMLRLESWRTDNINRDWSA